MEEAPLLASVDRIVGGVQVERDAGWRLGMGVQEQIIFPEINYDEIDALRGMDIVITTTARNAEEGKALLEAFNFPFKK